MSTLSIKVNIAGRTYPLTIDRSEEEGIRKIADAINKNIKELQENYAVRDMQDLLAMTALQLTTDLKKETKLEERNQIIESVKALNKEVELFLK